MWICVHCGHINRHPMGYCDKCGASWIDSLGYVLWTLRRA